MTAALEGGEWSAARPGRTLPRGNTRYPFCRRLGGPQGRSGRAENLAPPGFDPGPSSPVAQSLYRLSYRAHRIYVVPFHKLRASVSDMTNADPRLRPHGHQSRWSRCLRRGSATARLLVLRVRIPPGACLSVVSVVCLQVEVSATG